MQGVEVEPPVGERPSVPSAPSAASTTGSSGADVRVDRLEAMVSQLSAKVQEQSQVSADTCARIEQVAERTELVAKEAAERTEQAVQKSTFDIAQLFEEKFKLLLAARSPSPAAKREASEPAGGPVKQPHVASQA